MWKQVNSSPTFYCYVADASWPASAMVAGASVNLGSDHQRRMALGIGKPGSSGSLIFAVTSVMVISTVFLLLMALFVLRARRVAAQQREQRQRQLEFQSQSALKLSQPKLYETWLTSRPEPVSLVDKERASQGHKEDLHTWDCIMVGPFGQTERVE